MTTTLITGAAGFIGMCLAEKLMAQGDHVIGIDSLNDYYQVSLKLDRVRHLEACGGDRFTFHKLDFSDMQALESALQGSTFSRIVHLGAQAGVRYSIDNPHVYAQSNLFGHLNLLELARHRQVEHLVYASSSSVYGGNETVPFRVSDRVDRPLSFYAATKKANELMSETYSHLYRLPQTGLRFFTVYGPWGRPDMAVWNFTQNILAGKPIRVFNHGAMRRDFTYIDDIVAGIIACLANPPADDQLAKPGGSTKPHSIYNIGNHKSEELMRLIEILETACGRKAVLDFQPMQNGDVLESFADIDDISRDFGYKPTTSIEVGVPNFVHWYMNYHAIS